MWWKVNGNFSSSFSNVDSKQSTKHMYSSNTPWCIDVWITCNTITVFNTARVFRWSSVYLRCNVYHYLCSLLNMISDCFFMRQLCFVPVVRLYYMLITLFMQYTDGYYVQYYSGLVHVKISGFRFMWPTWGLPGSCRPEVYMRHIENSPENPRRTSVASDIKWNGPLMKHQLRTR